MSTAYAIKLQTDKKINMRKWCNRPGKKGKDGKPQYFTQQNHKRECDVNYIIRKYDKTGLLTHVQGMEGKYGDITGADFRKAQDLYINSQRMFDNLPSEIRNRFQNNPGVFLEFMEDTENRAEAIKLGLIRADTPENKDGLGEHVKADDYKEKDTETKEQIKKTA